MENQPSEHLSNSKEQEILRECFPEKENSLSGKNSFNFFKKLKENKKLVLLLSFFSFFVLGGLLFVVLENYRGVPSQSYTDVYRFLPEKVSQSGIIAISLPEGISKEYAKQKIVFNPEISGRWLAGSKTSNAFDFSTVHANEDSSWDVIYFKPNEQLELGSYYEAAIQMREGGTFGADFLVVEDPEIIAVFPADGEEISEYSEITVVFNRPMVPLTTLTTSEAQNVPVEIIPKTPGKWKWITTQNLQFIPDDRLNRSSIYRVSVKSGFVSMDGLPVYGEDISFSTRKLRTKTTSDPCFMEPCSSSTSVSFDQPLRIVFNQPVDLEKTIPHISLFNNRTGKNIPFIAEYADDSISLNSNQGTLSNFFSRARNLLFAKISGEREDDVKKSVIEIYNGKDRSGRKKLWDFDESYSLIIEKTYPAEGNIYLDQWISVDFQSLPAISSVESVSERTFDKSIDLFDPQGELVITFYEEIDIKKTSISAPDLKEIVYGEKCKEEKDGTVYRRGCEKVDNKKELRLTFNSNNIGVNTPIPVSLKKLISTEGVNILEKETVITATSYSKLIINSTSPSNGDMQANLQTLIVCSNNPLNTPPREEWNKYIKANEDYHISSWGRSFRARTDSSFCPQGDYATYIYYGLMPNTNYRFNLLLEDVFGQQAERSVNFTTGGMEQGEISMFSHQRTYSVAPPNRTILSFAARNVNYVDVSICKLPAYSILYYANQWLSDFKSPGSIVNCTERRNDRILLPEKYWVQKNFHVDLKEYFNDTLGHYIVTVSHPDYYGRNYDGKAGEYRDDRRYVHSLLSITNIAVAEKKVNAYQSLLPSHQKEVENIYWVNGINNFSSLDGATVSVYRGENLAHAGNFVTNTEGIATTPLIPDVRGVIVTHGKDSAILTPGASSLNYAHTAVSGERVYFYTDKPIYQPSQTVHIKGIHRVGYDSNYEIIKGRELTVIVTDPRRNEIFSKDVKLNDYGTFNIDFLLDAGASLGQYEVCIEWNCMDIDVQEYVGSPYEVKAKTDQEEYISKDTVNIEVEADYFFGVPLSSGEVTYTLSSQNYHFDRFTDRYFSFGAYSYYYYPFDYGDRFMMRGKTNLKNGKAVISEIINQNLDKEDSGSRIITADITVQTPEGESVSTQISFIVHAGEYYLGVSTDNYFLGKNQSTTVRAKSLNTDGKEIGVKRATMIIKKIEWDYIRRRDAYGGYSHIWERNELEIEKINFDTNKNGDYQKNISFAEEGEYIVEVSGKDKRENEIISSTTVYVYGGGEASISFSDGTSLDLEVKKSDLKVGETAEVIIKSPYDSARALITIERGKVFDYHIRNIEGNIARFTFPIKEEYAPNVFVSVLLQSKNAEVRFGTEKFTINSDKNKINVDIKTNKENYLPGEEVKLQISATDSKDKPVVGEFSLSVVDLSVLALKGNPKKNPLIFFYEGFPLTVKTSSNIVSLLEDYESMGLERSKGGGGATDLEARSRGDFREVAVWRANIITNKDGKAQVDFRLPDNLTRWQAEAIGVTQNTKLGVGYSEFTSRKELMVNALMPRFILPGDTFLIGAKVFNQTEEDKQINISIDSESLEFLEEKEQSFVLKKDSSSTVYFKVNAPENTLTGSHRFTLSAEAGSHIDTVTYQLPINEPYVYETVSTAQSTSKNRSYEYIYVPSNVIIEKGSLDISVSATLAVFLSDGLNYLIKFPYGCIEQVASRLKAIAVIKRGMQIPNIEENFKLEPIIHNGKELTLDEVVEIEMSKISTNQMSNGGFSMWPWGGYNFHVTLHVIDTLNSLKKAGYEINESVLKRASDYIYHQITNNSNLYQNNNNVINTVYVLRDVPSYSNNLVLKDKIVRIINDEYFMRNEVRSNSLAKLAVIVSGNYSADEKQSVFNNTDGRLLIDSRGAFLPFVHDYMLDTSIEQFLGLGSLWSGFDNSTEDTAIYLKAISLANKEHHFSGNMVRWLINSRSKNGSWGNTATTSAVIEGMTEHLLKNKETESNFAVDVAINNKNKGSFSFDSGSILEQHRISIPLTEIGFNKINTLTFNKNNRNQQENTLYYDATLKYYLPVDQAPPRDEGFSVVRSYFSLDDVGGQLSLKETSVGNVLRVNIQITIPKERQHILVEDFIPAGFEIVNLNLATEQKSLRLQDIEVKDHDLNPDYREIRNDRAVLYRENIMPGVYEFNYYIRAIIPGEFVHLPTTVIETYFPENFGRSAGGYFKINK